MFGIHFKTWMKISKSWDIQVFLFLNFGLIMRKWLLLIKKSVLWEALISVMVDGIHINIQSMTKIIYGKGLIITISVKEVLLNQEIMPTAILTDKLSQECPGMILPFNWKVLLSLICRDILSIIGISLLETYLTIQEIIWEISELGMMSLSDKTKLKKLSNKIVNKLKDKDKIFLVNQNLPNSKKKLFNWLMLKKKRKNQLRIIVLLTE